MTGDSTTGDGHAVVAVTWEDLHMRFFEPREFGDIKPSFFKYVQ